MKKQQIKEEEKHQFPLFVKRKTFDDVGKFVKTLGKYIVYDFLVKGELASPATALNDTLFEITEHEYKSVDEEDIKDTIIKLYKNGKPLDLVSSHQIFIPSTGETIEPDKKKQTEKPIGKNGEVDQKSLREKLNSNEVPKLKELCENFAVDCKAYDHLSGGLLKMSLVNKLVGTIGKQLTKGTITIQEMEERIK